MPSMRFNARLDTSHHGSPHPFKDSRAFADSLTGMRNEMEKCFSVFNRCCFQVSPHEAMQWVLHYPSIGHENISLSTATGHDSVLSDVTHKLNVSRHMLRWTFLFVLLCRTHAQSVFVPFSYTLYKRTKEKLLGNVVWLCVCVCVCACACAGEEDCTIQTWPLTLRVTSWALMCKTHTGWMKCDNFLNEDWAVVTGYCMGRLPFWTCGTKQTSSNIQA
jgi:hypothetical protein